MSQEVVAQARHAFQDRLRTFLRLLSVMTDRELELAHGRLADVLERTKSPEAQVRNDVMSRYVNFRKSGERKERKLRRVLFNPAGPLVPAHDASIDANGSMYLIRCAANFALYWEGLTFVPGLRDGESLDQWVGEFSD